MVGGRAVRPARERAVTRVAAIDCGTNSIRLLIADVPPSGAHTDLLRRMEVVRLGEGVDATGHLAPQAIERTRRVLAEYAAAARELGADAVRMVATSASRDAANRADFEDMVQATLGQLPDVVPGHEEAELSFLGATASLAAAAGAHGAAPPEPPFLVVDIGGGSTEFVVGTAEPEGVLSIDVGCVRLTEAWLHSDPPTPEELSQAISVVRAHLADVELYLPSAGAARTLVGLAGTVTTVAAVEMGLATYDRDRIHHYRLTRDAAEEVFRTLATEPAAERRHNPGLEPGRVDVIVGGAAVLVSVMRHFGFDEMLVSEADILDGLVRAQADDVSKGVSR